MKRLLSSFRYLTPNIWLRKASLSRKMYYYTALLLMASIGIGVFLFQTYFASSVQAAWLNESWAYRRSIAISAHTSLENNVYLNLSGGNALDTSDTSRFQADCGDLRFTDASGNLLPYYIVSGCGSASTVVHVLFETFPAGAQDIYYYYGNTAAANGFSASDFSTAATGVTIGSQGSEENGPTPVAYWDFDDATGTVAKDGSPNGRNGTLSGATLPAWTKGQCVSGSCLFFNGITSQVTVSSTVPGVKSVGFWVNPGSSASGELMALNSTTHIRTTTGTVTAPGTTSPTVYVNGKVNGTVVANTWNYITVTTNSAVSASAITLGRGPLGILKGFMDDVKFYPTALTTSQINANYTARGSNAGSGAVLGASDQGALSSGLLGYWKMDEITQNTCSGGSNDSCEATGSGFDGLWNGNATASDSGKFSWGTVFDGSGDYVTTTNNSYFAPSSAITISGWYRTTALGNSRIMSRGSTSDGYELILLNSGSIECNMGINSTEHDVASANFVPNDGQWHHVACTYDGKVLLLYIDGVLQADRDQTAGTISYISRVLSFGISAALAFPITGNLDEMRIYNRALSPDEVSQLYNYAPSPFLYYDFEEGSGSSVIDKSGNSFNGTWAGTGSRYSAGKYGKGGTFNGSDDTLTIDIPDAVTGAAAGSTGLANGTFSFWMRPTQFNAGGGVQHRLVNRNDGGNNNGDVLCGINGSSTNYECDFDDGVGIGPSDVGTGNVLVQNAWNYITVTWEHYGHNTTARIYHNGVLKDSVSGSQLVRPFKRGLDLTVVGIDYVGQVDEYRMYNYARNPKQIIEDMNASHPSGGSPVGSAIGYWKFDAGTGNVASNSGTLGAVAHGQMYSFASPPSQTSGWSQNGKFGKALNFDSTDDTVFMGSDSALDDIASLSASLWINPRTSGESSSGTIIDKAVSGTPANGWMLWMDSSRRLRFDVDFSGGALAVTTSTTIPYSSWSHVAVIWDGSRIAENVHIYINGNEVTYTGRTNGTGTRDTDASANLKVGASSNGTFTFDGWIDEVKLYNSMLSPSEVRVDYNRSGGLKFGVLGTDIDGKTASDSASRMYCPPGDTSATCAPIGEWLFEEGAGGSVADTSVSGNNGTWNGTGTSRWGTGKIGKAGEFNGTDDWVDAGSGVTLGAGARSVEAWVYVRDTSTTQKIFMNAPSNFDRFILEVQSGAIRGAFYDGTSYAASGAITTGWHHLVLTYASSTTRLYIDGTLQSGALAPGSTISGLEIGRNGGNNQFFNGKIDHVRLYNYELSLSQVAWAYNRGKPMLHWKADECQGSTLNDSSGNSKSGTITIGGSGTTAVGTCTSSGAWFNGVTGKFNASLDLDGTDDYVITGASPGLPTGDFSYSAWVNLDTNTDETLFLGADGAGGDELRVYINSSNKVAVYTNDTLRATSGLSVQSGIWTHILVTRSGSTIKIFINGIQDVNTGTDASALNFSTCGLVVGADSALVCSGIRSAYLDGKVDEVQVFNYGLTQSQAQLLYNQGSAVRFGPSTGTP